MNQFQIERYVGIDEKVAKFIMISDHIDAKTAMDLLRLQVSSVDRCGLALLKAAVDSCKKLMEQADA